MLAANKEVPANPQVINRDPYRKGWLLKVRVPKMNGNRTNLLSGELAASWMKDATESFFRKISRVPDIDYFNNRPLLSEIADTAHRDRWNKLVREFLLCE